MKKALLIFALILFCSTFLSAQTPLLQWAKSLGEPSEPDMGIDLIPDNNGNLFLYGRFSGTVDFDPGPGVTNLTAGGNFDIFIGKYNPSGALLWIKKIGGSIIATNNGHLMNPYDATVDNAGNLFITGLYVGIVDVDPSAANTLLYPDPSGPMGEKIFVASYTNNGDFRWGFGYGYQDFLGGFYNSGYEIKIDLAGDVIVSGMYHHTCDFDPSAVTYNLTATGSYMDIFFAKYSNTGNFIWAKSIGGGGVEDTPTAMVIDSSNNVYICGYIDIAADFDPSPAVATVGSNGGGGDIFLAKYNASGDYQWAFSAGNSIGYDIGTSLAVDYSGNICMAGNFKGTVDFDPSAATFNLSATGTSNADAFLSKYSSSGNFIWSKSFGGVNHENTGSMVIDQYGRIIISGDFSGLCDFDPSPLTEFLDAGLSPNAAFITQFDNDGNFLNVMAVYGPGSYLFDHGMVVDNNENLYYTGGFEGTVDFDPSAANFDLTSSSNYQDIYMAKYSIGTGTLFGRIWNDVNSNGIIDPGETGLPNIKVALVYDRNNNNVVDAYDGIITTNSKADGNYEFGYIAQGNYLLRVLPQPGYSSTTALLADADLTAGQIIANKNFGFLTGTIPVTCGGFSAAASNNSIRVLWKTLTEVNSKGFNLQRSVDGINFENIAWINAQGNSTSAQSYTFNDNNIINGNKYYYRLQEIDISGSGKYICDILLVKTAAKNDQVYLYPNPVGNIVNLTGAAGYIYLAITDMSGRKLKEMNLVNAGGTLQIPVDEFKTGMYLLNMYDKDGNVFPLKMFKK